jgi:hypothetical protein
MALHRIVKTSLRKQKGKKQRLLPSSPVPDTSLPRASLVHTFHQLLGLHELRAPRPRTRCHVEKGTMALHRIVKTSLRKQKGKKQRQVCAKMSGSPNLIPSGGSLFQFRMLISAPDLKSNSTNSFWAQALKPGPRTRCHVEKGTMALHRIVKTSLRKQKPNLIPSGGSLFQFRMLISAPDLKSNSTNSFWAFLFPRMSSQDD